MRGACIQCAQLSLASVETGGWELWVHPPVGLCRVGSYFGNCRGLCWVQCHCDGSGPTTPRDENNLQDFAFYTKNRVGRRQSDPCPPPGCLAIRYDTSTAGPLRPLEDAMSMLDELRCQAACFSTSHLYNNQPVFSYLCVQQ